MTISSHVSKFAGWPVRVWPPESGDPAGSDDPDFEHTIYRLTLSWAEYDEDKRMVDKLAEYLSTPGVERTRGLVIGAWANAYDTSSAPIVEALVTARDQLPNLEAIFLGDITYEECEMSWIQQSDVSPLFNAYPNLEHFRVRGSDGLRLGALRHKCLKSLSVESGGLNVDIIQQISEARLPALGHLEIWLGTPMYGGDTTVEDLAPILSGDRFPQLRYLGLRDSEIADEIAAALNGAPILERVQILDISLGTLSDKGGRALLNNPAIAKLDKLDIQHHYCSDEMVEKLKTLGPAVDAGDPQGDWEGGEEEWRYVAVGE